MRWTQLLRAGGSHLANNWRTIPGKSTPPRPLHPVASFATSGKDTPRASGNPDIAPAPDASALLLGSRKSRFRRLWVANRRELEAARQRLPSGLRMQYLDRPLTETERLCEEARAYFPLEQQATNSGTPAPAPEVPQTKRVRRPPLLSARQRAALRRQCLLRGVPWPFDVPHKEIGVALHSSDGMRILTYGDGNVETYLRLLRKGHKHEVEREARRRLIEERMREMPRMIEEVRAERRALRRLKRTFGKRTRYAPVLTQRVDLKPAASLPKISAAVPGRRRAAAAAAFMPLQERYVRINQWFQSSSTADK
ncbi:hypothetical protein CDCA_CDCA01G0371 [Cyanidium caldarium]|uniref:Uncharacterized protein n=1 Tax=Cyanidium caldarium TaxID=2771 RepID=A0AAV9IQK3_CYACA|nr:hypothetical protein CDCA_CDCA01G0371 [Cyanidium caldarium]